MDDRRIIVAAVCFQDDAGRVLTVRKRGARTFVLPGGEPGRTETLTHAAVREVRQELGVGVDVQALAWLGTWAAAAADEPGRTVVGTVFTCVELPEVPVVAAEIDEVRWIDPARAATEGVPLAPLLSRYVIPAVAWA